MATTQKGRPSGRRLNSPDASENALFVGVLLVLCFGVLTIWTLDRWANTGLEVGIFALASLAGFRTAFLSSSYPWDWHQLPFAVAVIWGVAQLASNQTVYRFETWSAVLRWLVLFAAYSLGLEVFSSGSMRRKFRIFAVAFGAFIALWTILQLVSAEGKILWFYSTPDSPKPMGPFLSYDHYSAFMELLLPIALWEAMMDRRRALLYGGAAALMYASVIAGASRAGSVLVNMELGAVLIPALTQRASKQGIGAMALRIGALVAMLTAVVGWDELLKRFQDKDPFQVRREVWEASLAMLHQRPWFGFGLGTWTSVYPAFAVVDVGAFINAAHSDWLQWLGDGGLFFAATILCIALRALWLGIKAPWGLGVFFVFLHSLIDFALQLEPIFVWLTIVLAAVACGARKAVPERA